MSNKILKLLNSLERIITAVTAIIMIVLSILITYQVFGRYVLRNSPFWIEEISVVTMMWIGLLGGAGAVWTDTHMSLELVVSRLPERIRVWQKALVDIIIGLFAWFIMNQGMVLVQKTMSGTMPTLSIPLGYTYLILPIAGGLTVLFAFFKGINRVIRFYVVKGERVNA